MVNKTLLIAAVFGLLAAGCAAEPAAPGRGGPQTYVATEITDNGQPQAFEPGTQIRLTFDGTTLHATAGCNVLSGRTAFGRERLTVSELTTTDIACGDPFVRAEQWLARFLGGELTWAQEGETLTLAAGETRMRLRRTTSGTTSPVPHGSEPAR